MSIADSSVQWVRPPRQSRSQESLERILDAAEIEVSERGFEQATVADIVRRAKSSVGSFYARFGEKDALLRCLHDRFNAEAVATTDAVLDPARWGRTPVGQILSTTIPFLVDVYRQRCGLMRAFIIRATADPEFAERCSPLSRHLTAKLTELLLTRRDEIRHAEPRLACEIALQAVLSTLDMATLFHGAEWNGRALSDPMLGDELTRLFAGYLGVEANAVDAQTAAKLT